MGRVLEQNSDVLVIDDGSTDSTPCMLPSFPVEVIRHSTNRGYGRSLQDAFRWAAVDGYDWVVTMDCDEQHEPEAIPTFLDRIEKDDCDIISGSRYLEPVAADDPAAEPCGHQQEDHRGTERSTRPERAADHRRVLRLQGVPGRRCPRHGLRRRRLRFPDAVLGAVDREGSSRLRDPRRRFTTTPTEPSADR